MHYRPLCDERVTILQIESGALRCNAKLDGGTKCRKSREALCSAERGSTLDFPDETR